MPSERSRLEAELAAARVAMRLLRAERAGLRGGKGGTRSTEGPRLAEELAAARKGVSAAEEALLAVSAEVGPAEPASLRRVGADVEGVVRVLLPPGLVRAERALLVGKAVSEVLSPLLADRDVTLSAAADRYVRERGKDEEGRTVLDLRARIEGDFLVPVRPPAAPQASTPPKPKRSGTSRKGKPRPRGTPAGRKK